MSDLSIPGVTSKVDTKSMIEALMDVERAKLDRKEEEVKSLKNEKDVWRDVQSRLAKLQDAAKKLYGFQNPFSEKLAESSNESALSATADREAAIEEKTFFIQKIATADRFMSRSLDKGFEAPSGIYRFQVGDKEVSFTFRGGSLKELADAINQKAGKLLSAGVINDTDKSRVIIIEAKDTGSANTLTFHDAALEFGLTSGMLMTTQKTQRDIPLQESARAMLSTSLGKGQYSLSDGRLTLEPASGEVRLPLSPPFELNSQMMLEIQVEVDVLEEEIWTAPSPPSGPEVPPAGGAEFQDVKIENERSLFIEPEWEPPEAPERIEDRQVLFMGASGRLLSLPEIDLSGGIKKIQIPVGEMAERIDFLIFRNRNTYRRLSFSEIRIFDPTARGDHKPVNALSEAGDAVIEMDGVKIIRATNEIDDLIPGVNLTFRSASDAPVTLSVKRDVELIKEDIVEFVGHYNRVLTLIDIVTRNDSTILDDVTFLSDAEQREAEENLGMLQGDITLSQLKNRLRTIVVSPYQTSAGSDLSLLVQLGIATDTAMPGSRGSLDKSRLRGYLDIDEAKLQEALGRYADEAKDLFGVDSDADFVVDSGVAFSIDQNVRPYVVSGGILDGKAVTLDTTIQRRDRDIDDFNQWLEDYEASLKRKFGMMEGALQNLEDSSRAIENFNKSNQD